MQKNYIKPIQKVNRIILFSILPTAFLLWFPLVLFHEQPIVFFKTVFTAISKFGWLLFFVIAVFGGLVHELLHAAGWIFFTKGKLKSVYIGIKWDYLTPYCHCKEPLKRNAFIFGAILPFLTEGLVPLVISYASGNIVLWAFSVFFILAAGGDIICVWMLRKVRKGAMINDHPEELGFMVE